MRSRHDVPATPERAASTVSPGHAGGACGRCFTRTPEPPGRLSRRRGGQGRGPRADTLLPGASPRSAAARRPRRAPPSTWGGASWTVLAAGGLWSAGVRTTRPSARGGGVETGTGVGGCSERKGSRRPPSPPGRQGGRGPPPGGPPGIGVTSSQRLPEGRPGPRTS